MKYFEAIFELRIQNSELRELMQDARDVLAAMAGEAGFETFEETETGLKGYVQQALFDEEALKTALDDFPFEGITVTYDIHEAEYRDWNEQWENEGFEPIVIPPSIIIHDGRHLPTEVSSNLLDIEIDAKLAFGTGTHETTRMVCSTLLSYLSPLTSHLSPLRVLDCGTGTGILSICALKLGAASAIGYDIDEWSVDNARHNAVINQVDDRFTALLGDASILYNKVEGLFDLVLANINRNILLNDMPLFRQKMAPDARLILSGFYTDDIPLLVERAATLGLTLESQKQDNSWACLTFRCN
jgi:ribosomal protein L11 methyltransferase